MINDWFSNCDSWGAKEWYERIHKAVKAQDKACVEGDKSQQDFYTNIIISSSLRLAREHNDEMQLMFKVISILNKKHKENESDG